MHAPRQQVSHTRTPPTPTNPCTATLHSCSRVWQTLSSARTWQRASARCVAGCVECRTHRGTTLLVAHDHTCPPPSPFCRQLTRASAMTPGSSSTRPSRQSWWSGLPTRLHTTRMCPSQTALRSKRPSWTSSTRTRAMSSQTGSPRKRHWRAFTTPLSPAAATTTGHSTRLQMEPKCLMLTQLGR